MADKLLTTPEENQLISAVISWMSAYMLRLNLDPLTRPLVYSAELRVDDSKKVDLVIAGGMDRLRPVIKQDFYEKLYDKLSDEVDNTAHPNTIFLWTRMMDTLSYVISITKRFRGQVIKPPIAEDKAKKVLAERGLWKAR